MTLSLLNELCLIIVIMINNSNNSYGDLSANVARARLHRLFEFPVTVAASARTASTQIIIHYNAPH